MPALKDRGTRGAGGASGATGYPYGQARSARGRWTRREEGRRDKKALGAVGGGVDGGRGGRNGLGGPVRRPAVRPPKSYDNPGRGQPQNVIKGDFDEDGVVDLAMSVGNAPNNAVSLFRGKRNGTFAEPPRRFDAAEDAAYVVKSDFNGDGPLDLAISDFGAGRDAPGSVAVLFGTGEGTFKGRQSFPSGGKQPSGLAAPDVDGDGDEDLAVANGLSGSPNDLAGNVTVLLNNGAGAFKDGQSIEPPSPPSSRVAPVFLAAGDLDGDGDPDLVATVSIVTQAGGEAANVL